MIVALAPSRIKEIDRIIAEAEVELRPIVKRIFWESGPDWSGDLSITMNVVLSNNSARMKNLTKSADRVRTLLNEKLQPDELGVIDYYSFRSEAEHIGLGNKAWK